MELPPEVVVARSPHIPLSAFLVLADGIGGGTLGAVYGRAACGLGAFAAFRLAKSRLSRFPLYFVTDIAGARTLAARNRAARTLAARNLTTPQGR